MKLSTRVRYGLRAMIELAKAPDSDPVPVRKLAQAQSISIKYLEQLAKALKIAGLIESVRGAEGGYRLARPAAEITAWDVYCNLDRVTEPIDCCPCDRKSRCAAQELWSQMLEAISTVLKDHTIKQLAEREIRLQKRKGPKG